MLHSLFAGNDANRGALHIFPGNSIYFSAEHKSWYSLCLTPLSAQRTSIRFDLYQRNNAATDSSSVGLISSAVKKNVETQMKQFEDAQALRSSKPGYG